MKTIIKSLLGSKTASLLCISASILLCSVLHANAVTIYVGDDYANLYTVDTSTGNASLVGNTGEYMADIAFDPSGNLWGIAFDSLYSIDKFTGDSIFIGWLGVSSITGMTFDMNGILYASDGLEKNLYTVNTSTGSASVVGNTGYYTAGDLEFDSAGNLYLSSPSYTSFDDSLIRVDPATGNGSLIGPTGYSCLWGLAFADDTMYGFAQQDIITLDLDTGSGTFLTTITGISGWAAGAAYEPAAPVPEPSTLILLASGLIGMVCYRRKRRNT